MWRLKQARHSERSLLSASEGHGWKGKQPLLNEPLKECSLYLGFIIFIVNPSQPSSASHSFRARAAKYYIIHQPKSQGWKISQLNDKYDYRVVISKSFLSIKVFKWDVLTLFSNTHTSSRLKEVERACEKEKVRDKSADNSRGKPSDSAAPNPFSEGAS